MFYFIIFQILFLFALLEISNINKRSCNILTVISVTILILIAGLRYETGGDWDIYAETFKKVNPIFSVIKGAPLDTNIVRVEPGFLLFCSIIKQLNGSLQTIYFLIVCFNIILITKSLELYTKYVIFGLFVYYSILYFMLEMIITRQSIAASMTFFAMRYVNDKNFLKYMLVLLVASCFHRAALIMIPLYFFFIQRYSTKNLLLFFILGAVLMLLQIPWFKTIFLNISFFLGDIFGEGFRDRAVNYVNSEIYGVPRPIGIGFFLNMALLLVILWRRKYIEEYKYANIFINMFFVANVIYYYGYELIEISNRFRFLLLISVIVVFPYLIEGFIIYTNKLIVFVAIAIYAFLFNRGIYLEYPEASAYNPYQNYIVYKLLDKKSTGEERLSKSLEFFYTEREKIKKESEK